MGLARMAVGYMLRRAQRRLTRPNGAVDRVAAIAGLGRAICEGLAEEVVARVSGVGTDDQPIPYAEPRSRPAESVAPVEPEPTPQPSSRQGMTVVALKDEARRRGIAVPRRIKKADLIALLEA